MSEKMIKTSGWFGSKKDSETTEKKPEPKKPEPKKPDSTQEPKKAKSFGRSIKAWALKNRKKTIAGTLAAGVGLGAAGAYFGLKNSKKK